jgi:hypothetical protein
MATAIARDGNESCSTQTATSSSSQEDRSAASCSWVLDQLFCQVLA